MRKTYGLITDLHVFVIKNSATRGFLIGSGFRAACAIGRSGVTALKREGDGGSPIGRQAILSGYYRPDRMRSRPTTSLPLAALSPTDGWCDDSRHAAYNRQVRLPFPASHEQMWRADRLYDLVLVLDWNLAPRRRGAGSAIFLHIARDGYEPTAGCIALSPEDMRNLLKRLAPGASVGIGPRRFKRLRP